MPKIGDIKKDYEIGKQSHSNSYGIVPLWFIAGCLVIFFVLTIGLDLAATTKELRGVWSQVTIEDVRKGLNIAEKTVEKDLFEAMTYRGYITDQLIGWTPENWATFLDFCDRTGYIVTDDNWQRYIHGEIGAK